MLIRVGTGVDFGSGSIPFVATDREVTDAEEPVVTLGILDIQRGIQERSENRLFVSNSAFIVQFDPDRMTRSFTRFRRGARGFLGCQSRRAIEG